MACVAPSPFRQEESKQGAGRQRECQIEVFLQKSPLSQEDSGKQDPNCRTTTWIEFPEWIRAENTPAIDQ